jgi:hypothetical protein
MITKTRTRNSDLSDFFGLNKLPKSSIIMKQKLISMAKKKKAKPHWKTKEGRALGHYTCKYSYSYCLKFKKTIKKIAPFWFASSSDQMKQKLVQMAKNKEARPQSGTKEGMALSNYTKKHSGSYCEKFDKLIRRLAPVLPYHLSWFRKKRTLVK